MATTTNYSWTTPDDTALVKDGAAAIRTLGSSVDTTVKNLNPETTLGDIAYRSSTANVKTRLALGTAGQVLTVNSGATAPEWKNATSGAITWTNRKVANGEPIYQIAYNGSNLYVAVASGGFLYTSADGITWTSRTSGFGANAINSIVFGNGIWVAAGGNGTITTSTDGITWTSRTANMSTNNIQSVVYDNSLFVAVGAGGGTTNTGGITYSTDGITWTRKSQSLTVGNDYNSVLWNGTNWIVGANVSTNNYLYASTPAGTWTADATGSGTTVNLLAWDGTRHITVEGTSFRYSTSNTLGTTTSVTYPRPFNTQTQRRVKYYNNKLHYESGYYVSAIPATSLYWEHSTPIIGGNVSPGSTAGTISGNAGCLWVGAAGIIVGSNEGQISTSF
jgi:hypothetical protein